jgi:SAM-dependent methyltransferase
MRSSILRYNPIANYLRQRPDFFVTKLARAVLHHQHLSEPISGGASPVDKEDWEFDWQRDNWCALYRDAANHGKVLEYWIRYRFLNEIRQRVAIEDDSVVLDVGCGISTVLHYLPGRRFGIDPLADRYKDIYSYPAGIDIRVGYGEAIPFDRDFFDIVTCSNCIDHTNDPAKTMREIRRVMKPGGHAIITCEIFDNDRGVRNEGHPHSMTVEKLLELSAGFEKVAHWDSPWIGLRNFVLGDYRSAQREHILLLRKQ